MVTTYALEQAQQQQQQNKSPQGLRRRDQSLQPESLISDQKKRAPHYMMSILRSFDLREQTWKRLSNLIYPRMRLVLLETFHYPTKNKSEEKMKSTTEPDIIPWEKKAGDQAVELAQNYEIHGMQWVKCLDGVEPEIVEQLERLIMPITIDVEATEVKEEATEKRELTEEEKLFQEYSLAFPDPMQMGYRDEESLTFIVDDLIDYLQKDALRNVIKLKTVGSPFFMLADSLRREVLLGAMKARREGERTLQETHMEIEKVRAGQKGKTSYDPYDEILMKSLGIEPRTDMITRSALTRNKNKEHVYAQAPTIPADLLSGFQALQNMVTQLVQDKVQPKPVVQAAPVETKPARPMKLCPACAEEIYLEAKFCKHCQHWLKDVPEDKPETSKKAKKLEDKE